MAKRENVDVSQKKTSIRDVQKQNGCLQHWDGHYLFDTHRLDYLQMPLEHVPVTRVDAQTQQTLSASINRLVIHTEDARAGAARASPSRSTRWS